MWNIAVRNSSFIVGVGLIKERHFFLCVRPRVAGQDGVPVSEPSLEAELTRVINRFAVVPSRSYPKELRKWTQELLALYRRAIQGRAWYQSLKRICYERSKKVVVRII